MSRSRGRRMHKSRGDTSTRDWLKVTSAEMWASNCGGGFSMTQACFLGKLSILFDDTRNSGVSEDLLPLPLSWDCILTSLERTSCGKLQQMQHQGCKQGTGRLSLGCAVCGVHAWTALQIVACNGMHTAFNLANVQQMMKGHTAKVSDLQLEATGLLCGQA